MLAINTHHFSGLFQNIVTDASFALLEPEPQSGGTYNDFLVARLDPDNRIGTGGEDVLSRNFNWSLPILGMSGRSGLDLGLSLTYNSLVWTRAGSYITFDADGGFPTPGFHLGFPAIYGQHYNSQTGKYGYLVLMPSGSRVEMRQVGSTNLFESSDSSYLFLVDNGSTLLLRGTDGTQLSYVSTENGYRCSQLKDKDGNFLTVSHNVKGRITSVVDTLGRTFTFNYDTNQNLETIKQTRGATQYEWARFGYTNLTLQTNFPGLSIVGLQNGATLPVLSQVSLPDGTYYKFSYSTWGQVHKITNYAADSNPNYDNHPLNYVAYNLPLNQDTAQTDCPRFTQRKNWAENWNNFNEAVTNFIIPTSVTQLPDGTQGSTWTFRQTQTADGTYYNSYSRSSGWDEGLQVLEDTWANEGQGLSLQRRSTTAYTQDNTGVAYQLNPRVTETNVSDSANNRRRTTVSYSTFSLSCGGSCSLNYYLPNETREYAANATDVLRTTQTDYNTGGDYTSRRIFGLVSEKRVYNTVPAPGNLVSKISFEYDDGGESLVQQGTPIQHDATNFGSSFIVGRGNLTRVRRWDVVNTSQFVESKIGYNTTGAPIFNRDPLNHQTSISYTDSFSDSSGMNTYAFPTTATDADGNQAATRYSYHLGLVTRTQGPPTNSPSPAGATGAYLTLSYDSAGRLVQSVNSFNSATVTHVYPSSSNVTQTYTTIRDTSSPTVTAKLFDGAGRLRAAAAEHPGSTGGYIGRVTVFDVMGRPVMTSNPTEINGGWGVAGDDTGGWVWSQQTYDWKGRPRITTNQDGTTKQTIYSGCGCAGGEVVTTLDELGRKQQTTFDVLGRVASTRTFNLDGVSVHNTTSQVLNARDQVVQVTEQAGVDGPGQQFQMTYDGYGRLAAQHSPEQATGAYTSYTYSPDDTLLTSTDARGATTTYSRNSRHLVTAISYSAPAGIQSAAAVTYTYDSAGNQTSMVDEVGRVDYQYDQLSRLISESRRLTDLPNAPVPDNAYVTSYSYNLNGQLTGLTDPFGYHVGYTRDVTGRLSGISCPGFDGHTDSASDMRYRAWGALKRATYSWHNNSRTISYSYNQRFAETRFEIGGPGVPTQGSEYQRNAVNGVHYARDLSDPQFDRAYTYDQSDRVVDALSGAEARGTAPADGPYKQSYSYDAWGNVTGRSGRHWTRNVSAHTATYNNNRNTQWQYDADGRLIQEQVRKFFFDAAGRQTKTGSINSTITIPEIYDGNGFRVKRPSGYTTYELRSKVLDNQVIAQIGPEGQKHSGYIYAEGKRAAKTSHEFSNNYVFWEHKSPTNGALFLGMYGSVVARDKEFDPYMDNVGTENPYLGGGGDGSGGYPSYGNPGDFGGGCAWEGTPISCSSFQKVFSRNSVALMSWIIRIKIGARMQERSHIERFDSGSTSGGDSGSYNRDGSVGYAMNVVGTPSIFESTVTGSVMHWLNLAPTQSPPPPPVQNAQPAPQTPLHCLPDFINAMKRAWAKTGNGTLGTEAGFGGIRKVDNRGGTFPAVRDLPYTNQKKDDQGREHLSFTWSLIYQSIWHVHSDGGPPSSGDRTLANDKKVPVYSFGPDGLYIYRPGATKGEKLRNNLEWTKDCPPPQ